MIRNIIALLVALTCTVAFAQIGVATDLAREQLQQLKLTEQPDGALGSDAGYSVTLEEHSGLLFALEGSAGLTPEGSEFIGNAVGIATGMGAGIAEPVAEFLTANSADLVDEGPVSIPVQGAFLLDLDVTAGEPPVAGFRIALHEIDEDLFVPARHTKGSEDAQFVIREFADFQCPYCGSFASEVLPQLEESVLEREDVRFEFHHMPLVSIHANAMQAAEAVECVTQANSADTFWTFGVTVFERMQAWQTLGETGSYFTNLASELGLETAGVTECLAERTFLSEIQASYESALQLGVTGTPSVFVNGFRVGAWNQPQSYLQLIELLAARDQDL